MSDLTKIAHTHFALGSVAGAVRVNRISKQPTLPTMPWAHIPQPHIINAMHGGR